ncbi:MAG: hypothetical protein R3179_03345 [Sedimenticolaceae bacterium]|nr:hypothetical protein [Sedimenticolaceae bacterium]
MSTKTNATAPGLSRVMVSDDILRMDEAGDDSDGSVGGIPAV